LHNTFAHSQQKGSAQVALESTVEDEDGSKKVNGQQLVLVNIIFFCKQRANRRKDQVKFEKKGRGTQPNFSMAKSNNPQLKHLNIKFSFQHWW
jgi:hypothetical protein